jgi:8-oxo-dGTP pyrophosphatase MutT (NUDIX family)
MVADPDAVGRSCFADAMPRVVLGALVRDGYVLLVHRRFDKHANPNVWDVPGGVMVDGESELEALTRELREELGVLIVEGSATHLCRLTTGPADDPAQLSAWLVPEWEGAPTNEAPEEHDDMRWFDLRDLPPPPHVIVREALLNAFPVRRN